ncbi:glycosyltransferase [Patescibacteria group bacterium]|nr:glycosyltransferase [Patescibacteria group bacterium]
MDKKQVTIIVTVLNKKDTIRNCIDSILNLNYKPNQILIMDNGSSDGTYKILQEYGNKIDLFQAPIAHSALFNMSFDKAKTELIALTDADCIVDHDWLDELIKGFNENEVIATAGFCGTPKDLSYFQTVIGLELENRFKRFPKYISRAPTMNLALKTDLAKKVRFDEKQGVDVEVDFGYRLIKFGKMRYMPQAKVYHYHRSNLKGLFKQQKGYAKWGLRLVYKHGRRAMADQLTTLSMSIQIPILSLAFLFLILSIFDKSLIYISLSFFLILLILYIKNIFQIKPSLKYYPGFFWLFIVRNIAWIYGIIEGTLFFIKEFIWPSEKELKEAKKSEF